VSAGPLLVEFTGLPGVGKTTVTRAALSALRARGVRAATTDDLWERRRSASAPARALRRARRVAEIARFGAQHPDLVWHAHAYASGVRPLNRMSLARAQRLVRMARTTEELLSEADAIGGDVILLEQGGLQELWSALVTGRTVPPMARLHSVRRAMGPLLPHLLVMLVAPPATVAGRIAARRHGTSRFDRMDPALARPLLEEHARSFDRIIRELGEAWCDHLLVLDAMREPQENAEEIADVALNLAHKRGPPDG
jgi:thymidylate kinase